MHFAALKEDDENRIAIDVFRRSAFGCATVRNAFGRIMSPLL
jgi:hypothetical protein